MKPPEEVRRELAGDWLARAHEDLGAAEHLMDTGTKYFATIAYHAQQAAEKYLKAYLVERQIRFPRTHDLVELLDLIAGTDDGLAKELEPCAVLNPFGVEVRYPGNAPAPTMTDANEAIKIAQKVRSRIQHELT